MRDQTKAIRDRFTYRELAKGLHIGESTLYAMRAHSELPAHIYGQDGKLSRSACLLWAKEQRKKARKTRVKA